MSDSDAQRFVLDLADLVERTKIFPSVKGVNLEDWYKLSIDNRRWLTGGMRRAGKFRTNSAPDKPYYVPFSMCVADLIHTFKEQVHFSFGIDRKFSQHALGLYNQLKDDPAYEHGHLMGTFLAPPSKDTPGLQAADMVCYLLYQSCLLQIGKKAKVPKGCGDVIKKLMRNRKDTNRDVLLGTKNFHEIADLARSRAWVHQMRRTEHQIQQHSTYSEGTSHPKTPYESHRTVRWGQCIEGRSKSSPRSKSVQVGRPVRDPRLANG
jgi:hypothetical protein